MKRYLILLFTAALLLALAACSSSGEEGKKDSGNNEDKTLTFGVTPWTSTVPPTEIAKIIVENMGYTVKEVKADVSNVFIGMSRGDVDIFMDGWFPSHNQYTAKIEDDIELISVSYDNVQTGLVVPTYMKDFNKVSDIRGKEDILNHEVFGIEEGAGTTSILNDMLKAYDLDVKQVNSSEGAMLAQAQRLMNKEAPVVFYGWRPHSMFNKFDLKMLDDDEGEFFERATVQVVATKSLKEDAPDVYEFLSNWSIPINDVEEMIVQIENESKDPAEVAQNWIDENQDKVNKMLGE